MLLIDDDNDDDECDIVVIYLVFVSFLTWKLDLSTSQSRPGSKKTI